MSLDDLLDILNDKFKNDAGVTINDQTAMSFSTYYSCVKLISESISQLPLTLYERTEEGRQRADNFDLYDVLKNRPNDWMTASGFIQWVSANLLTRGIAYSLKVRRGNTVIALHPLPFNAVEETWDKNTPEYRIYLEKQEYITLGADDLFVVRGLTTDGKTPVSPIGQMRHALGLGIAAEKFGARFFGNNARPAGILESDNSLSPEAIKNLKEQWSKSHGGDNMHKLAVLTAGLKWKQITMSAEDSQFLETRRFQRSEICGMFLVPPHMIGDTEKSSSWGTGIEQLTIGFIKFTLGPWLTRIEQSVSRDLLTRQQRKRFYPEFLTENLLRGDTKSRNEAYKIALGGNQMPGYMSVNEVRKKENMPPMAGEKYDAVYLPPSDSNKEVNTNEQEQV